jgi:hypothetical protein
MQKRIFPLLPLLGILAAPLAAQVVRGKVLDAASGEPVAQAEVTAATLGGRGAGRARSAADGTFTLELRAPGTFRLRAERTGYRPTTTDSVAVDVRETLEVELRLSATAVGIEPLRVTARVAPPHRRSLELNGVYDRARDGFGRRLFREDIERQSNMSLGQVLARVNGTNRVQSGPFEYILFGRSAHCLPNLYVDGSRMAYGGRTDINSVVTPGQIEAVELYSSAASVPLQYGGSNAACGVILIWTRAEP